MNSEDLGPYADLYIDRKLMKKDGKSYEAVRCEITDLGWDRAHFRDSLKVIAEKVGLQKIKIVLLGAHGTIGGTDFLVYRKEIETKIPAQEVAQLVREHFKAGQVSQGKIYCCWSGFGEQNLASVFAREGGFPTIGFRNTIIVTAYPFPITEQDLKTYSRLEKIEKEFFQIGREVEEKEGQILPLEREIVRLEEQIDEIKGSTELTEKKEELEIRLKDLRKKLELGKSRQKLHQMSARYYSKKDQLEANQQRLSAIYRERRADYEVRFLPLSN